MRRSNRHGLPLLSSAVPWGLTPGLGERLGREIGGELVASPTTSSSYRNATRL
jgi:hypothetical protein